MAPKIEYRLHAPVPALVQKELSGYDPLTQQLLCNRGITESTTAEAFLHPDYDRHLHDPFLLTDMSVAVERILSAIQNDEHIIIYSDYDCDGIPGGVLMYDFFEAVGFANFENYIPHRHEEGYGFNKDSVGAFVGKNTKLIITVDCGIVDHEATEAANKNGIDVIITDHHEPSDSLPPALAVLNPKRADDAYPFKGLCGTGVAYKLVQALIEKGKERKLIELKEGWEKWWLDVVGIATIADMVPLTGENRTLAHYGLQVLRKSRRPGLQQLMQKAGGSQRHITEDDIGFTIGPRINAASRMDDPEDAFHMLRTKDEVEAGERVRHLEKLNNERKGVVASMTKEVKKRMKQFPEVPGVIVLGNPDWRPSLVGLVANSIVEEFRRPAFLWGRDGKNVIKGSCRSDGVVSTLHLMEATPDSFLEFGGHHASGGFSVSEARIHTLMDDLNRAHEKISVTEQSHMHEVMIDAELSLDDMDDGFIRTLAMLAPFGEENPKPVFRIRDVVPNRVEVFGKTKNHTKLVFDTKHGRREAIAFFKTPDQFGIVPEELVSHTLIAHVERSHFMGKLQTRLRIIDIV